MSQFFRLSTSELASILELVIEVPDHLSVGNRYLNEVAGKTVARRWRGLHPDQSDPPRFPENFEIETLSNFDPKSVWPQYGSFEIHERNPCLENQTDSLAHHIRLLGTDVSSADLRSNRNHARKQGQDFVRRPVELHANYDSIMELTSYR
jgi:hypothetical protein